MKTCTICKRQLSLDSFNKKKSSKDGHQNVCEVRPEHLCREKQVEPPHSSEVEHFPFKEAVAVSNTAGGTMKTTTRNVTEDDLDRLPDSVMVAHNALDVGVEVRILVGQLWQ